MTDSEFLDLVDTLLGTIEARAERLDADVSAERSGNVLNLEFDDGSKIVINSQVALHEMWMAARSGGFHFRWQDGVWRDSKSGEEFLAMLSRLASEHAGSPIDLSAKA
jgi:CyaY protein